MGIAVLPCVLHEPIGAQSPFNLKALVTKPKVHSKQTGLFVCGFVVVVVLLFPLTLLGDGLPNSLCQCPHKRVTWWKVSSAACTLRRGD